MLRSRYRFRTPQLHAVPRIPLAAIRRSLPDLEVPELGIPELPDMPGMNDARVFVLFLMPAIAQAWNEASSGVTVKPAPEDVKGWLASLAPPQIELLEKLNRADAAHLARQPVLVVPQAWEHEVASEINEIEANAYSPIAREWPSAAALPKAIYVDLSIQAFAAYEKGVLVHWGPISSGAAASATPAGTYHLNWRARKHASTVNQEWRLPWYFNLDNQQGIAFHQYDLPGTAASHGCIRLLERDARWLFHWGDTWALSADGRDVTAPGTPVLIHGTFQHRETPPWRQWKNWLKPIAPPAFPQALRPAA